MCVFFVCVENNPRAMEDDDRPFVCVVCDKRFKRKHDLHRHDSMRHLQIKTRCVECGTQLGSRGAYQRHRQRFHGYPRQEKRRRESINRPFQSGNPLARGVRTPEETRGAIRHVVWHADRPTASQLIPAVPPSRRKETPYPSRRQEPCPGPGADSKNASPVRKRKKAVPDATVALTDYYPTTNERKVYRKKMETWMRRITRETETIDEEEFVLRMLSQDGELGYMCTQTVRYMVRLHNCMLAKKTSEHSKSVSRRKSSKPKGEKVEDSSFPPRAAVKSESRSKGVRRSAAATATVTLADMTESTPDITEVLEKLEVAESDILVSSARKKNNKPKKPLEEPLTIIPERSLPREIPPRQLMEEDSSSTGVSSPALGMLAGCSSMQFQALQGQPTDDCGKSRDGDPFLPVEVELIEAEDESSELLIVQIPAEYEQFGVEHILDVCSFEV